MWLGVHKAVGRDFAKAPCTYQPWEREIIRVRCSLFLSYSTKDTVNICSSMNISHPLRQKEKQKDRLIRERRTEEENLCEPYLRGSFLQTLYLRWKKKRKTEEAQCCVYLWAYEHRLSGMFVSWGKKTQDHWPWISISKLAGSSLTFSPSVLSLSASIYQPTFREQLNTCCSNNKFYFTLCTALSFSQNYC